MLKRKVHGFVLLTTLFFMQLFSLLSIYGLQMAASNFKLARFEVEKQQQIMLAKQLLQQVENNIFNYVSTCQVAVMPMEVLAKKEITWWQQFSCKENKNNATYYIAIETLSHDPCGVIEKENTDDGSVAVTAQYYRVNLFLNNILLQSVVATRSDQVTVCSDEQHLVQVGRQMWRRI